MSNRFAHLHTHSHYSLLEALPKIDELIEAAKADGHEALALTDAGNMYGAIEFYKAAKAAGIKPIIGVDFFVAPRTRYDKEHRVDDRHSRIVLLAKDLTGYKHLIQLVSKSFLEGFHLRPRIDRALMEEYRDGLIAILPSIEGEHVVHFRDNMREKAEEALAFYHKTYGDDLFLEISHHPEIDGHEKLQGAIKEAARLIANLVGVRATFRS